MDSGIEINNRLCKVLSKKYYKKDSEEECLKMVEKYFEDNDLDSLMDSLSDMFGIDKSDLLSIASDCTKVGRLNK